MSSAALCRSVDGGPPILKIGASTNEPDLRAQQLTASTSAPTAFTCVYSRWVDDVTTGEARVHEMLAHCRINERREFFGCSIYEACLAVDRVAGGAPRVHHDPPTPLADLFATFPDDGGPRELTESEQAQIRALGNRRANLAAV